MEGYIDDKLAEGGRDMLSDIEKLQDAFLTPAQVSKILGCDPNSLRATAHRCPEKLGFPVCIVGRRVKFPREAFLRFMRGNREEVYLNGE